jgi:tetratricopeptide (TPR) repeat protein
MKKINAGLTFSFLIVLSVSYAQKVPSKAELDKLMKQVNDMAEKAKKDPRMAAFTEQANEAIPFGQKNKKAIAALSDHPLTGPEIKSFLNNIKTEVLKKVGASAKESVKKAAVSFGDNVEKLDAAAVMAWYNSSPQQALLLSLEAGVQNTSNLLALNNLAAILNLGGVPYKAVPILKTIVQEVPQNAIALNNLGQAYARMGMLDSSIKYLKLCTANQPYHPEANNTAGLIESFKGNNTAAVEYFKNSLRGAFTENAAERMNELAPGERFSKLVRPRVQFPSYFNENKFKLPAQCENVWQADSIKMLHEQFEDRMQKLEEVYNALKTEEGKLGTQEVQKQMNSLLQSPGNTSLLLMPFSKLGMRMMGECAIDLGYKYETLSKYLEKKENEIELLTQGFHEDTKVSMSCEQFDEIANRYLAKMAIIRRDIQVKQLNYAKLVYNDLSYWGYLAGMNVHLANAAFYGSVSKYLGDLRSMAKSTYQTSLCPLPGNQGKKEASDEEVKKPECPFDINIPFIVGKLVLNCDKFSFKAGEALVFSYEKDFSSQQSTISIGAGLGFETNKSILGISGSANVGASESFYICFDANNSISDAGISFEANATASATAEGGLEGTLTLSKEVSAGASMGYKIGINSGISFNEGMIDAGPLSNIVTPLFKN